MTRTPLTSATVTETSVVTSTVVAVATRGGAGSPTCAGSFANTPINTRVGMAMAVSLSQYWNACTKVIDRIPPPTTFTITMSPTPTAPVQTGAPSRMLRVSPAPWNWGMRYSTQTTTTTTIAVLRTAVEESRNSAKSGTV